MFEIHVTQENIDAARKNFENNDLNIETNCAVAIALREKFDQIYSVDYFNIRNLSTGDVFEPTDIVAFSNWLSDFDSPSQKVEPITFEFVEKPCK